MGWTSDLLAGAATHLAHAGIGLTWHGDGTPYAGGELGIYAGPDMPQQPDRAVVVSLYPVEDNAALADVTVGMQIRVRGTADPRTVDAVLDDIYDVLHGLTHTDMGGVHVVVAWRNSAAPLGSDTNGRRERADTYYLRAMRPTATRPD